MLALILLPVSIASTKDFQMLYTVGIIMLDRLLAGDDRLVINRSIQL